jgi:hypothetical protein
MASSDLIVADARPAARRSSRSVTPTSRQEESSRVASCATSAAGFASAVARRTSTIAMRLVASRGSSPRWRSSASLSGSSMTSLTRAEESA